MQFLDFAQDDVLVKSPILAQYILTNIAAVGEVVSILSHMAARADAARLPRYDSMLQSLMRFSSIQLILPVSPGQGAAVVKYYESIKNLYRCKTNPLFWLQYAIACLAIKDLFRSRRYFETAYSLTSKKEFNTFQIDNHFARFLLVEAVDALEVDKAMDSFRQARTIINRQIRDERLHYPYRVASQYQPFLDRFGSSLSSAQVDEVGEAATYVKDRIESLPHGRRRHRYVKECWKAMDYVVDRVANRPATETTAEE